MQSQQRVFLIDGMALLFRSFFAMGRAGLTTPEGVPIGAVYGFMRIIVKLLKEQNPTHFAVLWDLPTPTFRHVQFAAYKANRSETPSELVPQIPLIRKLLEDMGVPAFSMPGFEADDLIGTFAKRFSPLGEVLIVSADKDFLQLVDERVKLLSLKSGDDYEVWGRTHVVDYFGVPPEQVIDVLAIMGDQADNVPGVKGIGGKGAAKLIGEFGSLAAVYENLERVSNVRTRQLLTDSRDLAFLSQKLVTIDCNVPLECLEGALRFDLARLAANPRVREDLTALRMGSIAKIIFSSDGAASSSGPQGPSQSSGRASTKGSAKKATAKKSAQSSEDSGSTQRHKTDETEGSNESYESHGTQSPTDIFGNAVPSLTESAAEAARAAAEFSKPAIDLALWGKRSYTLVQTRDQLATLCARIASPQTRVFSFDTETTGLDVMDDRPIGASFSFESGEGFYVPANSVHLDGGSMCGSLGACEFTASDVFAALRQAFAARKGLAVAHNLKFDLHQLLNVGVELGEAPIACTMVAAWLLNPVSGGYGLDNQTLMHLQLEKISTSQLIGKTAGRKSMLEVPLDLICEYACEDADATLRLWETLAPQLTTGAFDKLYFEMEMPVLRVLADMERVGVHIDHAYLLALSDEIHTRLMDIEQNIFAAAGESFNIASPKQLGAVLFEKLKVHETLGFKGKLARTTLGFKTDAGVLEQFAEHPCVALVQEYRELSKLLNTYIIVLPQLLKKSTGRIHTSFNQIGTATGRLSSSDPNLQNIPVRTIWGKKVRRAFCANAAGHIIISADYSQIELRVLAHMSGDENMLEAFRKGSDIHRETAAKILGKEPELVTPEERSSAKAINFGILYGMGSARLAREQGISFAAAKAFIERYFLNFSKVREFLDSQRVQAHETGSVKTLFGRVRPIPSIRSPRAMEARAAENIAINSPIQGTAADIMKLGMLRAHKALQESGLVTRIVLQVHDELVLEGPIEESVRVTEIVRDALQGAVEFSIPLLVEVSQGLNWLEAK